VHTRSEQRSHRQLLRPGTCVTAASIVCVRVCWQRYLLTVGSSDRSARRNNGRHRMDPLSIRLYQCYPGVKSKYPE
jgi:hypothetical protein